MIGWLLIALVGAAAVQTVRAALAGSRPAADTLLGELTPVIRARARRAAHRTPGHLSVDDLTQEVWLRLVADEGRLLLGYDPTRGHSLRAYVATIAGRVARDVLRDAAAQKRGGGRADAELPPDDALPANAPADRLEQRDQLRRLLEHLDATLPERGRLVLRFLYADGASPQRTAEALGMQTNAVYNWRYKIRKAADAWLAAAS